VPRLALLAAAVLATLVVPAAAPAQVTCRSNALGAEICVGLPAPAAGVREPYRRAPRGLAGVQPAVRAEGGPVLTPARRRDALGNTFLDASDLPPARPPLPGVAPTRACRRDALGNLVCR
jgi:hypothetical protein